MVGTSAGSESVIAEAVLKWITVSGQLGRRQDFRFRNRSNRHLQQRSWLHGSAQYERCLGRSRQQVNRR
jgi:hypothetical protein